MYGSCTLWIRREVGKRKPGLGNEKPGLGTALTAWRLRSRNTLVVTIVACSLKPLSALRCGHGAACCWIAEPCTLVVSCRVVFAASRMVDGAESTLSLLNRVRGMLPLRNYAREATRYQSF